MDFLADYMDDLFPPSPRQGAFLDRLAAETGARSVLDVGCGHGRHLLHLRQRGLRVLGVEPSEAMRSAAVQAGLEPREVVDGRMDALPPEAAGPFDLLLCLGNTLALLGRRDLLNGVLASFCDRLRPGGAMALQTVNFDRVPLSGVFEFPVVQVRGRSGANLRFLRRYEPAGEDLWFHVRLEVDEAVHKSTDQLLRLPSEDLRAAVREAGFEDVRSYGDFAGAPFEPVASSAMVLVGVR